MLKRGVCTCVLIAICLIEQEVSYHWCNGSWSFLVFEHCYTAHLNKLSWYDANEYCKQKGSVLAMLNSKQHFFGIAYPLRSLYKKEFWIGANEATEGEFVWIANNETYNFLDGLLLPKERCAHITNEFNDFFPIRTLNCSTKTFYVCMNIKDISPTNCVESNKKWLDGTCFTIYSHNKTWWEAKKSCEVNGAALATFKFKDQINEIMAYYTSSAGGFIYKRLEDRRKKNFTVWIGANCFEESQQCIWTATNESLNNKSPLVYRKNSFNENKETCLFLQYSFYTNSDYCTTKKEFVCMNFRKDSMFIKEFKEHGELIFDNVAVKNRDSTLNLNCTVKTYSLPSKLSITQDGGSPLVWQENTTSLSIIKERVDCKDIGQYTCELEDIETHKMEKVIFPVWVKDCPPVLCENPTKVYNISDEQVKNWSIEVCIRHIWEDFVHDIELVLLQNSSKILIEYIKRYVYNKVFKEPSLINWYYNITIFNVSSADVGKYEMYLLLKQQYLIIYNFEITGSSVQQKVEKLPDDQDNKSLILQLGLPVISVVFLLTLGGFIRCHMLKTGIKERQTYSGKENLGENIDSNMEYYEIPEINAESSKSFPENHKNEVKDELHHKSCQSSEDESRPALPPRSRGTSDYQQIDTSQNDTASF